MKNAERWFKAAEEYRKQPEQRASKATAVAVLEEPLTLSKFLESEDGKAAMDLLKAAGGYILIAESEAIMSRSASVSLDGNGLQTSYQTVGMAAAYTTQKPTLKPVSTDEAMEMIREYDENLQSEGAVIEFITFRLNEIAKQVL